MNITKENIISELNHYGSDVVVNKKKTKELIGVFKIISLADLKDCKLNGIQRKYVESKKKKYFKDINKLIDKLIQDKNTRQAIIQFNTNSKLPECISSIQYIIRNNKLTICMCSRSMDIKSKYEQDLTLAYDIAKLIISKMKRLEIDYMRLFVGSMHFYIKNDYKNV